MTASKVFIIVLILIAVLFVAGIGIGFHQNDSQPDPHNFTAPNWTNMLSDWLSPSLDLTTLTPVTGSCIQPAQKMFMLSPGTSCVLRVPSVKQNYRKLKLHLITGGSATLSYASPPGTDGDLSKQQLTWPGKDPQSLLALAAGGKLTLTCGSAPPCQLQAQ
jgi:hypothetical protein